MKKVILMLLACCLVLTACGAQKGNESGLSYDCTEYTSLDEMNAAVGTNIQPLGADETDEKYEVITDSIAQYTFKIGEEEWCVRASQDLDNDISGLYYEDIGFEKNITSVYYNDEVYMTRFFNEGVQYTISLNVLDKDIARSYYDSQSSQIQTNITGVQAGYENEVVEEGDNVVYRVVMHNDDGSTMTMEVIYAFENDKMVSILNNYIFDTEEAAKEYYDMLIESGYSAEQIVLEGKTISSENNSNLEFYSDYTKAEFLEMMQSSIAQ